MFYRETLLILSIGYLLACGENFSGNYQDEAGITHYQFEKDGRAIVSLLGTRVIAEYKLDDNKIFITSPQGTVVLTRNGKTLYGPMGLELMRQEP